GLLPRKHRDHAEALHGRDPPAGLPLHRELARDPDRPPVRADANRLHPRGGGPRQTHTRVHPPRTAGPGNGGGLSTGPRHVVRGALARRRAALRRRPPAPWRSAPPPPARAVAGIVRIRSRFGSEWFGI